MRRNTIIVAAVTVVLFPYATSCTGRKPQGTKQKKAETSTSPSSTPANDDDDGESTPWGGIGSDSESQSNPTYGTPTPTASTNPFDPYTSPTPSASSFPTPTPEGSAGTRGDRGSLTDLDKYVGTWDGTSHQRDPKSVWEIAEARDSDIDGSSDDNDSGGFFDRDSSRNNSGEVDCLSSEARNSNANVFVFRIRSGTGANGAYNSRSNPCVVKSGKELKFVNDDDADHMPHFNGAICPHPNVPGDTLRRGSNPSWSCTARQATNGVTQLYDHLAGPTSGADFYIEVVQ